MTTTETAPTPRRLAHRIPDVAELLDVSAATVWRLIREGDLKVMRLRGGTTRVTDESLQRLVHGPQSPPKASMRRVVAARATP